MSVCDTCAMDEILKYKYKLIWKNYLPESRLTSKTFPGTDLWQRGRPTTLHRRRENDHAIQRVRSSNGTKTPGVHNDVRTATASGQQCVGTAIATWHGFAHKINNTRTAMAKRRSSVRKRDDTTPLHTSRTPSKRTKLRVHDWDSFRDENTKIFPHDTRTLTMYTKQNAIPNRSEHRNRTFSKKKHRYRKKPYNVVRGDSLCHTGIRRTMRATIENALTTSWKKECRVTKIFKAARRRKNV